MGFKVSKIDELRQKLFELPDIDVSEREVTKQEAIRRMADAVASLQKRGYSMERISEILTSEGVAISVSTLKSYLTKAKKSYHEKGRKKVEPKSKQQRPSSALQTATPESQKVGSAQTLQMKTGISTTQARSSSFTPRNDSDEI